MSFENTVYNCDLIYQYSLYEPDVGFINMEPIRLTTDLFDYAENNVELLLEDIASYDGEVLAEVFDKIVDAEVIKTDKQFLIHVCLNDKEIHLLGEDIKSGYFKNKVPESVCDEQGKEFRSLWRLEKIS